MLHYLPVSLDVAISQAEQRRITDDPHAHVLSPADITHLHNLFEEPGPDEDLEIRIANSR